MGYLDYLMSEYEWCLNRYTKLGHQSYMARMMKLELLINEYKQNATDVYQLVA